MLYIYENYVKSFAYMKQARPAHSDVQDGLHFL